MSEAASPQADPQTPEQEAAWSLPAEITSCYVDRAGIHVQPFTLHLILGATSPEGNVLPRVHLTMSPPFAAFLRDALTEAVAVYQASNDQAGQANQIVTE